MGNMVSVGEAAHTLNVSEQYIRRLLKDGKLAGWQVGKTWIVSTKSLTGIKPAKETQHISDKPNTAAKRASGLNCLSFFSGAMGLDIGLEQAGISPLIASEIDPTCRKTIIANKPDIGLIGDIRNYTPQQILDTAGIGSGEVDVIVGGPPCQAFSTAGNRNGFNDERGNAFLHFIDLITALQPKYAVIENVRGLLSAPLKHIPHKQRSNDYVLSDKELKGGALLHILSKLRAGGYEVSFNLYNAANFGSPQIRERVVLLCARDGTKMPYLQPTHAEHGELNLPAWRTLREALQDLPEEPQDHVKFPDKRLRYYKLLKAGQNWRDLPENLQKEALGNSYFAGGGKTGFFRRLAWDKPAPTLVTHPAMPATDLAHPEQDRPLSVQEYKRIQEFPDGWIITGNLIEQYRQLGNAVPISLGRAIGKALLAHINGEQSRLLTNFQYSRYLNTDEASWEKSMFPQKTALNTPEQFALF